MLGTGINVTFEGGMYKAKVVGDATSTERHRWITAGTFSTTAAATITPVVSSGTLDANVRRAWNVISGTLTVPLGSVLPMISDNNFTGLLYAERKEYDLKW